MSNAKLIEALRWCQTRGCSKCIALLENGSCKFGGAFKIFEAAAAALEAADIKIADCIAAIDALDDSNDAYIKENERLKKRIAELEAKIPKWFSVKDRLPDSQRPVLVYVPESEGFCEYVGMADYTWSPKGGFWCGTDGDTYGAIGIIHEPTAWMELPEPPSEDMRGDLG